MLIYVRRHEQQLGPFTEAEVRVKFAAGALSLEDRVWWHGEAEWVPLGESSLPLTVPPRVAGTVQELPDPSRWESDETGPTGPAMSNFAIISLTCGCFALVLGFFTAIPAIILGHLALRDIRKNPDRPGRGMALGGLVMGYVLTVLSVALTAIYLHRMPARLKAAEEAQSKTQDEIFFPQPPASQAPARLAPIPNDILFQPPPVDYSSTTNSASSKSNAESTKAPDASTNAAPASGQ